MSCYIGFHFDNRREICACFSDTTFAGGQCFQSPAGSHWTIWQVLSKIVRDSMYVILEILDRPQSSVLLFPGTSVLRLRTSVSQTDSKNGIGLAQSGLIHVEL